MKIPRITLIATLCFFSLLLSAQTETQASHDARMQWWREARFGLFLHWGVYSVPAGEWNGETGYGEWIRTSAQIPLETYEKFVSRFNPREFNADDWVRMARDAGMKYIVITSKHHDGFCMFDTKQTDFSIMSTPFHRDPMKDLAEACKKYGLKLCFYYSIMDWHHPDYLPRREWEITRPAGDADFSRYLLYMKAELKELLTHYGDIGVLWFDGEWEKTWNEDLGKQVYLYCRSLSPNLIINNRVGAGRLDMEGMTKDGFSGGDFSTPEQEIPATGLPGKDWETCMTMNDHWGYNSHDKNFKSSRELIRMLTDIASKGGNYLLNIGPTSEGVFPQESIDRLRDIGNWMQLNGEAIYHTSASPFKTTEWGRCTQKTTADGVQLFFHIFNWPDDHKLVIHGCLNDPMHAYILSDPSRRSLDVRRNDDALVITLPEDPPDTISTVVVLELQGKLDLINPPEIHADFAEFVTNLRVSLKTDGESREIHYTLDGSDPLSTSTVFSIPLLLEKSTVVTARCFRNGIPVSGISRSEFRKVRPLPPAKVTGTSSKNPEQPGLHYQYYQGKWDTLPDLKKIKMIKEGVADDFELNVRNQDEFFALLFTGYVNVPETAIYAFYTNSDDGSRLYIDGQLVVNNDGLHGMKEAEGAIPLAQGLHKIRVTYFNKTGDMGLTVSVSSTDIQKQLLPESWLYR